MGTYVSPLPKNGGFQADLVLCKEFQVTNVSAHKDMPKTSLEQQLKESDSSKAHCGFLPTWHMAQYQSTSSYKSFISFNSQTLNSSDQLVM